VLILNSLDTATTDRNALYLWNDVYNYNTHMKATTKTTFNRRLLQ